MSERGTAAEIVGEIGAEVVVSLVRTFAVVLALSAYGIVPAAVVLGLLHYCPLTVFGLELNTVAEPIQNLELLIVKYFDNRGSADTALTTRSVVISVIKIIVSVLMPMLSGLAYRWVAADSLPISFQVINQIPLNGDWASFVMTGVVVILAYHLLLLPGIFAADGYGNSLQSGMVYSAVSLISYVMLHSVLDMGVNIALAFAIFPVAQSVQWWYMLLTHLAAAAITLILYYLLWKPWFNADARRNKKDMQTAGDFEGLVNEKRQEPELQNVPSSRHTKAMQNFMGFDGKDS
jgi:hypothetical protein